jgi:hypothetical protein
MKQMHMRVIIAVAMVSAVLSASACGGDGGNGPTGPSSTIPNVTGNYSGNTTITFPELSTQLNCPTSTSVTQSGATVSIAPLVLRGDCGGVSVPLGQVTIDATGALGGGSESGTYTEPSCGTYNYAASGGFFGRELRISMTASSSTCYNFNFTATLAR